MAAGDDRVPEIRKCTSAVTSSYVTLEDNIEIPWLAESLDAIKALCKKVLPHWSNIPADQLSVCKISGGITNILFSVSPPERSHESPVIVRVFGPMTEKVIDRHRELQAMQFLSDSGFGAALLGRFGNGVVQSFISARTLTTEEMRSPEVVPLIATALARFHRLRVPGPTEPLLWETLEGYLATAQGMRFEEASRQARFEAVDFSRLASDVQEVKAAADALHSLVVFSHNDLLAGNVMLDEGKGQLHIIDFEYSAYGFRGYDIANHFCEYAGFECDYSKYPTEEQQHLFFRHYLSSDFPEKVSERELKALSREVSVFALASHLFWATWALIQARFSPIDFDYMSYFDLRYAHFCETKESALSKQDY